MWVQTQLLLVAKDCVRDRGGSSTKGAGPSVHKGSAGKVLRPPSECAVVTELGQGITGPLPGRCQTEAPAPTHRNLVP